MGTEWTDEKTQEAKERREAEGTQLAQRMGRFMARQRRERDVSAIDLGARLGLTQTGWSTWENAGTKAALALHNVRWVARELGLSTSRILAELRVFEDDPVEGDFRDLVWRRPELNERSKKLLVDLYDALTTPESSS